MWVIWKKRNTNQSMKKEIKIDTTYKLNHHIVSTLTIPSVQVKDEGIYQCVYKNSKGKVYSNLARLEIGSKKHQTAYHNQYEQI